MNPADIRKEPPPDGALNIAFQAVDRHVLQGRGERVALRWLPRQGPAQEMTYAALRRNTNRFANVLRDGLGLARGDRLFVLCERTPEMYVGILGALKAGLVACPLFPAFGPEHVRNRLEIGKANAVLTTRDLFERKVEEIAPGIPTLHHVLVAGDPLDILMEAASDALEIEPTRPGDGAFLHFTSRAIGTPQGAMQRHGDAALHYATGREALDLRPDDVYWCTADPAGVEGTSCAIVAPLLHGVTSIVDLADFDAERWYRILEEQQVTAWCTTPAGIHGLMKAGTAPAMARHFPGLRHVASVGRPLDREALWWGRDALGVAIREIANVTVAAGSRAPELAGA
jgi:acetyl-CoA synthetase